MSYEQAVQAIERARLAGVTRLAMFPCNTKDYSYLFKWSKSEKLKSNELVWLDKSITNLPPEICSLANLTELYLGRNKLSELPSEIGQLVNLTVLDIFNNQLTLLPSEIGLLSNLIRLFVSGNQLTTLPRKIGQLTKLKELYLSDNQLSDLLPEIGQLTNLTRLDLQGNQLNYLPPEIGQLTNLVELNLSNNLLKYLPPEIGRLTNLAELDLSVNALENFPLEITQLTELMELYLSENQLNCLPSEIGQLTKLRQLYLSENQLNYLPPEIGQLIKLMFIDVSCNKLSGLPPEIVKLINLYTLKLIGNPLDSPPFEIVQQGLKAIIAYLRQLQSEGMDILCEAKLLIVGEPGAGKTTLARKLLNPQATLPGKDESTRGIDIQPWLFPISNRTVISKPTHFLSFAPTSPPFVLKETFQANLWDFGGQEIYHATHRFFLTKRALYVLVADTREENTDFYYWLNMIELLGGDSPIIIVKNEMDNRQRPINEGQLKERFGNLKEVLSTNLADGRGLSQLLDTIQFQLTHLPHVGDTLPKSWVKVRQALEQDGRNTLDWREFLALCEAHGFRELAHKLNLSTYLHELGICLHYQDDPLLKKTVFLKPDWCTAAVYKVLDTREILLYHGHFKRAELETIWHEAEYEFLRDELLQLMLKFKLCYAIPGGDGEYIAPQLLAPEPPPYSWEVRHNLHLRYRYPRFMPKGIIATFTVMLHRHIWQQKYVWRGGLILAKDDTLAEIKEDYEGRQITIRLHGANPRDLLRTIIDNLDEIHDTYHNLAYEKLIPCNCADCLKLAEPHFYDFEDLRRRQSKGKSTVECKISYDDVNVTALLDNALGSATEQRRRGLDANLKKRLTTVLIECPQFEHERQFQALFVDSRIIAWQGKLTQADSLAGRVEVLLSELHNQFTRDGENALALFLEVLHTYFDPNNALHEQLSRLADEVRLVKSR